MNRSAKKVVRNTIAVLICATIAAACGGGGFGSTDITNPGNTPNVAAQTSFRIVGQVGTPFALTISDARSTWHVKGVIPLSVVIINNIAPVRISASKLVSDSSLLSVEVINGFHVYQLASTTDHFGVAAGSFGRVTGFAPPASPDVEFFVKGPTQEVFDALIEDQNTGAVVEATAPTVILFDSPAGGATPQFDGIFTAVTFLGGFNIDLTFNGVLWESMLAGTNATLRYP
ncbi:MAG TPA: hypothetical protein VND20_02390 [Candidatus Binataceae bacterium]|nr:hypothetical protein [Candidatus Binataceae bacterium]